MRLLACVLLAACATTPPVQPTEGSPSGPAFVHGFADRNIAGYVYPAEIVWADYDSECVPDEYGLPSCSSSSAPFAFTVTSIACEHCKVISDPTGTVATGEVDFEYTPTGDGPVAMTATLGWHDRVEQPTFSAPIDRLAGVRGRCQVWTVGKAPVPCGATRSATDTVIVGVELYTEGGYSLAPDCAFNQTCYWPEEPPRDAFVLDPAPTHWQPGGVGWYEGLGAVTEIAVTATANRTRFATTIAIPPIAP